MGIFGKIGKALGSVGGFIKKGVSFANVILNGPLGKIASFIPGVGPFIAGAAKIVGIADAVLNQKGGFKAVLSGLAQNFLGAKVGGLLSKAGLGSVVGMFSKAKGSGDILSGVSSIMSAVRGSKGGDVAEGAKSNMQQLSAFMLANLLRTQESA
jgi:hypothetical protein